MTAEEFASKVADTFGTQPRRHGREYRVPCVVHEADGGVHNPSLAIWDKHPGHYAFKCMTGCSSASVREALRERGIVVGKGAPMSTHQQREAAERNEARRVDRLIAAKVKLLESEPAALGGPTDIYLYSRGIELDHEWVKEYGTLRDYRPPLVGTIDYEMIGVICDLSTFPGLKRVTGITELPLNGDCEPVLTHEGKKRRSIVGTITGYAVPLGTPGSTLVIGEGIETTLAAMELLNVGFGAATLSASNMPLLAIPEWVTSVHVAMDNDDAGLAAARRLERSLRDLGLAVEHHEWGDKMDMNGYDAADELTNRKGL